MRVPSSVLVDQTPVRICCSDRSVVTETFHALSRRRLLLCRFTIHRDAFIVHRPHEKIYLYNLVIKDSTRLALRKLWSSNLLWCVRGTAGERATVGVGLSQEQGQGHGQGQLQDHVFSSGSGIVCCCQRMCPSGLKGGSASPWSACQHRHKDSSVRLRTQTYTSPVTPAFKRCQVLIHLRQESLSRCLVWASPGPCIHGVRGGPHALDPGSASCAANRSERDLHSGVP